MATSEWAQALAWIETTLNGDATITAISGYGGVWEGAAPVGTSRPFFRVHMMGGRDQNTATGGHRIYSGPTFLLVATGLAEAPTTGSQYANLDAMYARADFLITPSPDGNNRFPITLANAVILSCERLMPHALPYTEQGKTYLDLGGIYEITAKTH